jgi:branched-subunit amino acid transport protein
MAFTRVQIILITGLLAFALRALPQLFLAGQRFPEAWDRWLRYVSYGLICSVISVTLFMSAARIETSGVPRRALALALTVYIAHRTQSAVTGMVAGAMLTLVFSWVSF